MSPFRRIALPLVALALAVAPAALAQEAASTPSGRAPS